jgi:hypothetical protein
MRDKFLPPDIGKVIEGGAGTVDAPAVKPPAKKPGGGATK